MDSNKRFLDLYLGMPGSTNNACVLRRSSLYRLAEQENLFDPRYSMDGFAPFLLGDFRYPCLSWLMVPHQQRRQFLVLEEFFNYKLRKRRCVVENTFGIWKQIFRKLLLKSNLAITFLSDVITCCAILHNVLMGQSYDKVEALLQVLEDEDMLISLKKNLRHLM